MDYFPRHVDFLILFLQINNINFDTEPTTTTTTTNDNQSKIPIKCPVALQKETPTGLVDTVCNGDVAVGHAGLCR